MFSVLYTGWRLLTYLFYTFFLSDTIFQSHGVIELCRLKLFLAPFWGPGYDLPKLAVLKQLLGSAQGEVHHVIYFSTSLDAIKRYSMSEE